MKPKLILLVILCLPLYYFFTLLSEQAAALIHAGAFRDWRIFYDAGLAMRYGLSPFVVRDYVNPIQLAWVLQWTVWIPFPVWVILMCVLTSAGIVIVAKRNAVWYFLSLPFTFSIWMGMMDMFLWLPARLFGGVGLALLTLKPQLFALYAPFQIAAWIREKNWREIGALTVSLVGLWGIPTLFYPPLITDWLNALPTLESELFASSFAGYSVIFGNLIFYYALFAALMLFLLWKRSTAYYLASSFSPSFSLVDQCINAEFATWRYALLSWLLFPFGVGVNGAQQFFLLGILIFVERRHGNFAGASIRSGEAVYKDFDGHYRKVKVTE